MCPWPGWNPWTSVTVACLLADETSQYADGVLTALGSATGHAPPVWPLEVANVMCMALRRERITETEFEKASALAKTLAIEVHPMDPGEVWDAVISLARKHGISAYDASYLALALRENLPLATLDDRLLNAMKQAGVSRFEPQPNS